jgi:transcriptional regulator with XRE-family HTH domain
LVDDFFLLLTEGGVILYSVRMSTEQVPLVAFLRELMRRRKCLPSQLAADLGVSHATVSRWFSGEDTPSTRSCHKLAEYSGVPLQNILALSGHLPRISEGRPTEWPEFRDYAHQKYPDELDEDLITMIEDLIERRRRKRYDSGSKKSP